MPSLSHRTRLGCCIPRARALAALFAIAATLVAPLLLAAGDCDVCPRPQDRSPTPVPAISETGVCDVCPKPPGVDADSTSIEQAPFRDCVDCPALIAIPPADRTTTNAGGFALSASSITVAQWQACVAAGPCPAPTAPGGGSGTDPVSGIDVADARVYAAWLSGKTGRRYRLATPSESNQAAGTSAVVAPPEMAGTFRVARDLPP